MKVNSKWDECGLILPNPPRCHDMFIIDMDYDHDGNESLLSAIYVYGWN